MNGFLVIARCTIDEIPMRLFESQADAEAWAKQVTRDMVLRQAGRFKLDTSGVLSVDLLEFRRGAPQDYRLMLQFEETAAAH